MLRSFKLILTVKSFEKDAERDESVERTPEDVSFVRLEVALNVEPVLRQFALRLHLFLRGVFGSPQLFVVALFHLLDFVRRRRESLQLSLGDCHVHVTPKNRNNY